jgi:hypothetical protein
MPLYRRLPKLRGIAGGASRGGGGGGMWGERRRAALRAVACGRGGRGGAGVQPCGGISF